MANKFLTNIELDAGLVDGSNSTGTSGYLLSSTGTATSWIDQSTIASGSAEVVEVPVKNLQGSALTKGDPVYISGSVGASGILEVQLADAGNSAKMPAVGLLKQDLAINEEGVAVITGKLRNLITSPIDGVTPVPNTVIYVKAGGSTGAALTTVKPGGSTNLIQNMGKVGRVSTSSDGTLIVSSILRSNDVPNLPLGRLFVGTSANTSLTSDVVYIDDANDRVGIGTTSPDSKLDVSDTSPIITINATAVSAHGIEFKQNNTLDAFIKQTPSSGEFTFNVGRNSSWGGDFRFITDTYDSYTIQKDLHRFYILGSEKMRIDSSGNVGIGTTSPGTKLDVAGVITATGGTSTEWNTAYDNSIVSATVTGTTTKTLTLNQQDTGTITASWSDDTGSNNYVTGASFSAITGILTLTRSGLSDVTTSLDGRYLTTNQTITLSGDVTGSGTTLISTNIAANVVGAAELNVSGNGTAGQVLTSDGDGTFSWTTPTTGDITGVTAGTGLSGGGSSGTVTLDLDLGELTVGGTLIATDYLIAENGGVDNRQLISSIPLSIFNNDSGWTSNTGTVTSVGGTGSVSGLTLSGSVSTSGNLTLGGSLSLTAANVNAVGTISNSTTGNAATATLVTGTSGQLQAKDDRIIEPNSITAGRLQFGFTSWGNNNGSPYADYLHLRSYIDSSGGNDNLVMFRKDAIGMRIWQQSYGSATAYSSYKDVAFTDGTNASGTWGISISGNAATATSAATLTTARTINGTSFNGSANITTANWGTARTITIGNTGKSVNGSANVSWTLAEIGAQAALTNPITGTGTTNYLSKFTDSTTLGNSLVYDNGTNVGIGTTSPDAKLHIATAGESNLDIEDTGGQQYRFFVRNSDKVFGIYDVSNPLTWFRYTGNATAANTKLALLEGGGNVGIATTSPAYTLDVNGSLHSTNLNIADAIYHEGDTNTYIQFVANDTIRWVTGGVERMRLNSSGNLGINTTAPTEKLAVTGNIETTETANGVKIGFNVGDSFTLNGANTAHYGLSCGSSTSVPLVLSGYNGVAIATNGLERVRVISTGEVGIGVTNPAEKLEVVGNIKANKYINQRVAWNSTFSHTTGTGVWIYIPVAYITEQTADSYYLNWIAAYGGRVRKVVLRGAGTGPTQTATTTQFRVMVNGSTVYTTGTLTVTGTSPNKVVSYEFGDSDAVFSATDRVQVLFNSNGVWQNAAVGIIIEYTE